MNKNSLHGKNSTNRPAQRLSSVTSECTATKQLNSFVFYSSHKRMLLRRDPLCLNITTPQTRDLHCIPIFHDTILEVSQLESLLSQDWACIISASVAPGGRRIIICQFNIMFYEMKIIPASKMQSNYQISMLWITSLPIKSILAVQKISK